MKLQVCQTCLPSMTVCILLVQATIAESILGQTRNKSQHQHDWQHSSNKSRSPYTNNSFKSSNLSDEISKAQKEKMEIIPSWSQNKNHIETLMWAVKVKPMDILNYFSVFISTFGESSWTIYKQANAIAKELGLINLGELHHLKDWYLFSHRDHNHTSKTLSDVFDSLHHKLPINSVVLNHSDIKAMPKSGVQHIQEHYADALQSRHNINVNTWVKIVDGVHNKLKDHQYVEHFHQQVVRFRQKRSIRFEDPAFPKQWHLVNHIEYLMDINVTGVWEAGYSGKGVTVCVIDDGIEWNNPDLYPNYNEQGSWDLNDNDGDPMPNLDKPKNHHGTRCAGEIAAAANSVCAVGVAYSANISGLRVLDGPMTDVMEATAFTKAMDINSIYSCSWGPEDDGKTVDGPDFLASEGLRHGIEFGRNGYGSLYVVASGNGGFHKDNCNFDGYANSIYTITIGAIDETGSMPYYAEECASMLAVTFSSGNGYSTRNIVTTDWTKHSGTGCTDSHSGTSAAAPLASGMVALALEANPCLSWRDIQYLIILTAVKVDIDIAHWTTNRAGLHHSHKHGFGLMDAWRMVNAAKVWESTPWLTTFSTPKMETLQQIPLHNVPLKMTYTVTPGDMSGYHLYLIEQVQVQVWVSHVRRGDLSMDLVCPSGTKSVIAAPRPLDTSDEGFKGWTFTTVRCWGEEPLGTYTLIIKDGGQSLIPRGELKNWRLKIHGTPMTAQQFKERKRKVKDSFSGSYIKQSYTPYCQPPPETFEYNPVISQRWLKFVALTSLFCIFMAIYQTFEYIFCYNEEKKEEKTWQDMQIRAQELSLAEANQNNTASTSEYIPLENLEAISGQEINQRNMGAEGISDDWSCDLQMEEMDLGETSRLLDDRN